MYLSDMVVKSCADNTFYKCTRTASLKDVTSVNSASYSEVDRIAKQIPVVHRKPIKLTQMISTESPTRNFKRTIENISLVKDMLIPRTI